MDSLNRYSANVLPRAQPGKGEKEAVEARCVIPVPGMALEDGVSACGDQLHRNWATLRGREKRRGHGGTDEHRTLNFQRRTGKKLGCLMLEASRKLARG